MSRIPQFKKPSPKLMALLLGALMLAVVAPGRTDTVDEYVRRQMQRQHIPGISLAVLRDGRIVKAKGYGLANVELNVPARSDTVYEIGSLTKPFTATAIMLLAQDGKLSLDDKITDHVSGLPQAWHDVTIRHLLTHTSGIKGYLSIPHVMAQTVSPISISNLVSLLAPYPLEFKPGEKWSYSNTDYYLLGCIIENVSHKSFSDFLTERIFRPLAMNATRVNDLSAVLTNRASGYSRRNGRLCRADYMDPSWAFASGSLVSTVKDMAKWDAALYTDRLLPKAALEQMWTPVKLADGSSYPYGLGWYVFERNGHRLLTHSGGIPGFVSCIGRWVDDRVTVVVMLNSDGGRDYLEYLLTEGIGRRYIPRLVEKPIKDTVPQVTARIRAVVGDVISGTLDPDSFANNLRHEFFPDRARELQSELKDLGRMKALQLLSAKDVGKSRRFGYRAVFKKESALVDVTLDEKEKIRAFDIEIE